MLYLQLTMGMIDQLGGKLLQSPNDVLVFVEGVLGDEAMAWQDTDDISERVATPIIEVMEGDEAEDDEGDNVNAGIEKMGMVETAITLLLSSVDGKRSLFNDQVTRADKINSQ